MGRYSDSGSLRETPHVARYAALLFGAATLVSALGLIFPHQAQANDGGLTLVVIAAGAVAAILALGGERLPSWAIELALASATILISLSLVFNGERDGGAAGGDEVYFLWIALFSAYFFGRRVIAFQTTFIAVAYAWALYAIDPGPVAISRWLTMVGLVVGSAVIVCILSERNRQLVSDLDRAARTDQLTGLANRLEFAERFDHELARCERDGKPLALLLGDVDRLKEINDRWGHAAGDAALVQVARALRDELRPSDTAARLGGDEFAILMPEVEPAAAEAVATRLGALVREASEEPTGTVELTLGQATFPLHGRTRSDLMLAADVALYEAKPSRERGGAAASEPVAPWRREHRALPHYTF